MFIQRAQALVQSASQSCSTSVHTVTPVPTDVTKLHTDAPVRIGRWASAHSQAYRIQHHTCRRLLCCKRCNRPRTAEHGRAGGEGGWRISGARARIRPVGFGVLSKRIRKMLLHTLTRAHVEAVVSGT